MLLNTVKGICLIVVMCLFTACGESPPTPLPTDTPTPPPTPTPTSLPTQTPIPLPTATPIPGYVGGEEAQAYLSFLKYYKDEVFDCYFEPSVPSIDTIVDEKYPGKAVYVGDGIWRFYVQVISYNQDLPEEPQDYKEEVLQVASFSDQTWGNVCTTAYEEYLAEPPPPEPEYPSYEPYYPDETPPSEPEYPDPEEEPQEPQEPQWP